jgi:hypothetical protein
MTGVAQDVGGVNDAVKGPKFVGGRVRGILAMIGLMYYCWKSICRSGELGSGRCVQGE